MSIAHPAGYEDGQAVPDHALPKFRGNPADNFIVMSLDKSASESTMDKRYRRRHSETGKPPSKSDHRVRCLSYPLHDNLRIPGSSRVEPRIVCMYVCMFYLGPLSIKGVQYTQCDMISNTWTKVRTWKSYDCY